MANDAAGISWDIAAPALADDRRDGAQEVRGLRAGIGIRMDLEHVNMAAASIGGQHVLGSGMAYHQDATPMNTPGGVALAAADEGRLWVDSTGATEIMNIYDGAAFQVVTGVAVSVGTVTGAAIAAPPLTIGVTTASDLFIILVPYAADTAHFTFVVPLRNDAGPHADVGESTGSGQMLIGFERSGTDVILTYNVASTITPNGTAQWISFNFG